jgi:hypothetical protein
MELGRSPRLDVVMAEEMVLTDAQKSRIGQLVTDLPAGPRAYPASPAEGRMLRAGNATVDTSTTVRYT